MMWKTLSTYVLLASTVFAQQHVLSDNADTTTNPWTPPGLPPEPAINVGVKVLVQRLMQQAHIPGLSIGVVHPDNTIETASWGIRSEQRDTMTTDTLYDIASCSKAFLAATLGILMDDFAQGVNQTALPSGVHKFDWNTKVIDLLPDDWELMDEWATEKATLRDALSHQSGLPRHEYSYKPTDKPLDVIRNMKYLRPAFELRQRWHYNNQMYMLGAHLISTYSGMPYPNYIQERIFDRLNMSSTTFSPTKALRSGKRSQTWTASGRLIPFWFSEDALDLNAGPGGIISNVEDLTKWIRTMLNEGVDPMTNKTIIPPSAFEEITTVHGVVFGRGSQPYFSIQGYGMGWTRKSYQGHETVEHSGSIPGFSAEIVFLPSDKLGIVALANGDAKHKQELAVIYRIIEDYLKLQRKESERLSSSSVASQDTLSSVNSTSHPEAQSPPTLSIADYAGNYRDPGYGTFTLCAPTLTPPTECTGILNAFSPFYSVYNSSTPELYAAISSTWISHLRLEHKDGDAFYLHGTFLFPHGYGKDTSPFETEETEETIASAEFWVENGKVKGLALNGFVGEMTERKRLGGSIADTAEVWLEKV